MTKITIGLTLILSPFFVATATGQQAGDSAIYRAAYAKAVNKYSQSLSDQTPYLTGPQYLRYPFRFSEGHPYFKKNAPAAGTLLFDGIQYKDVSLMYDEVADQLVTEDMSRRSLILLPGNKIAAFSIGEDRFVRLLTDSNKTSLGPGFYQLLHDGKTKAFKKEIKTIQARANPTSAFERAIEDRTFYYLRIDGVYQRFVNLRSLLALFKEHKKAVRNNLREKRLEFRNIPDETIVEAVAFYDQLTK